MVEEAEGIESEEMILSKTEIKTVKVGVLNTRYCEILHKGETLPAHAITIAEAREILWIEDELHIRLIALVGHDFYPPDPKPEKTKSIYHSTQVIHPCSAGVVKKAEMEKATKIRFPVVVTSSIGSKLSTFIVEAETKTKADILAQKMIDKLGLKGARYKLS